MKQREFSAKARRRSSRSQKTRQRIYDQFKRRCWYCGKQLKRKAFILEHQQPFSKGGSCKVGENVVLSCVDCDRKKGGKNVEQFRQSLQEVTLSAVVFYGESGRNLKWKAEVVGL